MKKIINFFVLIISSHVVMYFLSGEIDIISNLIAAIEMVLIMAFLYSRTKTKSEIEEKQNNIKLQKQCE